MPKRLALIGNQAFSMLNFRSPLITALIADGVEVFALAPDYTNQQRYEIRALGAEPIDFRMRRNGINPIEDCMTFLSLASAMRHIKPDIALSYAIKPAIYGTIAATAAGVSKRFAMIEGLGHVFLDNHTLKHRALKAVALQLYRAALSRADHTFFLNEDDRADFLSLRLVSATQSTVIGAIGVDLEKWQPAPPVLDPMTYLFVGRLLREKGIIEFIEATRLLKTTYPNIRCIVLGDIDTNPTSVKRDEVVAWVKEGLIEWPGHVDVTPWIAQSSVFVLPSYREGVPRSTQEAMAMGRPVITTDVPGCRETVVDGHNGFMVPPRDSGALAEAMSRFLIDRELVITQGLRSRAIAERLFDVSKINAKLIALMM